jgi:hypothetical protein
MPEQWELLRRRYAAHVIAHGQLLETAAQALGALHAAGLRSALPIKGVAAAALLSASPPARDMADVDVLVDPTEETAARATLLGCGFGPSAYPSELFREHHHSAPLVRQGVALELHTALAAPGSLPFVIPVARALAERAVAARLCDVPIVCPCPEDCIIAAVLTAARDGLAATLGQWAETHWLLARSDPPVDRDRLRRMSSALRMEGLLGVALRFVSELFVAEPPPDLASAQGAIYERLRPILWRRMLEPHHPALQRHARVARWAIGGHGRGSREGRPCSPDAAVALAAPASSAWRALRYVADLAISRRQRLELRDEFLLRRVYRELSAEGAPPSGVEEAGGGRKG